MGSHTDGGWVARPDPHGSPSDWCISLNDDVSPIDYVAVCHERDAHLIAAAPDMLEALEGLLAVYAEPDQALCCDGRDCGCMGASLYQQAEHYARAAIAKAKGIQHNNTDLVPARRADEHGDAA